MLGRPERHRLRARAEIGLIEVHPDHRWIVVASASPSHALVVMEPVRTAVCTENLNPDVVVMESAEDRVRPDVSGPLGGARDRCIFI
jgi:hypothetical protein